jgi:dsRNA-specific ribonuclease
MISRLYRRYGRSEEEMEHTKEIIFFLIIFRIKMDDLQFAKIVKSRLKLNRPEFDDMDPYLILLALTPEHTNLPKFIEQYLKNRYDDTNYEALEFTGDTVLDSVVVEAIYLSTNLVSRSIMDQIKSFLVRNTTLECVGKRLNICVHQEPTKRCADYIEALIGAAYLHLLTTGKEDAYNVIREVIYDLFDLTNVLKYWFDQFYRDAEQLQANPNVCLRPFDQEADKFYTESEYDPTLFTYLEDYVEKHNVFDQLFDQIKNRSMISSHQKIRGSKNSTEFINNIMNFLEIDNDPVFESIDPYLILLAFLSYQDVISLDETVTAFFDLKYPSTNSDTLEYLAFEVLKTIVGEYLYFKYGLRSPSDLTKVTQYLINNKNLSCYFKTEELCPINQSEKECKSNILSLLGVIYVHLLTVDPITAYERFRSYVNIFLELPILLENIFDQNFDQLPCLKEDLDDLSNLVALIKNDEEYIKNKALEKGTFNKALNLYSSRIALINESKPTAKTVAKAPPQTAKVPPKTAAKAAKVPPKTTAKAAKATPKTAAKAAKATVKIPEVPRVINYDQ